MYFVNILIKRTQNMLTFQNEIEMDVDNTREIFDVKMIHTYKEKNTVKIISEGKIITNIGNSFHL